MSVSTLRDLLHDFPAGMVQVRGDLDVPITQLAYDSRCVQPGALFFALPGSKTDGIRFLSDAIQRGAQAIVVPQGTVLAEHPSRSWGERVTQVTCPAPRVLLGFMADRFYHQPSDRLTLVGVTGTSGKTTTTYLLEAIWQAAGVSPGVIGTVNYRYQGQTFPAPFTTPEAVELQQQLHSMYAAGVRHVVMEVSSHALIQERVCGCRWDGAVFTNLGRDHLDFHRDLDDYFAAKARLFVDALARSHKPGRFAVVNADDPWGAKLLAQPLPGRVLTYGSQARATVSVRNVEYGSSGLRGILQFEGKEEPFSSALIGDPHLANILAAATTAYALGVPPQQIVEGVARCTCVPGRLEVIRCGQPFGVLVDYAHKPDALEKTLGSVRRLTARRLLTVFGCGGDRDTGKRPLMGEVAVRLSDVVILTSDNPRTEDPCQIIAEAEPGLTQAGMRRCADPAAVPALQHGYLVLVDRREAIRSALAGARPGDVVVIAGKGHEDYQIIGTTKQHFDDREEVRNFLQVAYGEA